MPQADLRYTSDLTLNTKDLLQDVETCIKNHDAASGACKGRAYPSTQFHHSSVYLKVAVLRKPHRDAAFMDNLVKALTQILCAHVHQPAQVAVALDFAPESYITLSHVPD